MVYKKDFLNPRIFKKLDLEMDIDQFNKNLLDTIYSDYLNTLHTNLLKKYPKVKEEPLVLKSFKELDSWRGSQSTGNFFINETSPEENSPRPRSFKELDSWKDTEHSNNLLDRYLAKPDTDLLRKDPQLNRNFPKSVGFKDLEKRKNNQSLDIKFDRNLNLTRSPITYLPDDELIIYFGDDFYALSSHKHKSSTDKKLNLGGGYYFIKLESFNELEKYYLEDNAKEINSFKEEYINALLKKDAIIEKKYNSISKLLESESEDSIDALVRNYFFPVTKKIDLEKIILENKQRTNVQNKINNNEIGDIEFNNNNLSFFHELFKSEDSAILITGSNFYKVLEKLNFIGTKKSFEKKYQTLLTKKIKTKIRTKIDSYFSGTFGKYNSSKILDENINQITSSPHKDYGADKISKNEYILFKDTGKYGVEWNGKFYLFPSLRVGVDLTKTSLGYMLGERGFAYKEPNYRHPYIEGKKGQERRDICSAGTLDKIHSEIHFKRSEEDKARLMGSAKALLDRFENIIKRGHNSNHHPAHGDSIPKSAELISRREAEVYTRGGISFFKKTYGNED